jgi:cytochrome c biogenesis protein CcdA
MKNTNQSITTFLYEKENYILIAASVVIIIIGFFLMAGGDSPDPKVFDPNEVYSFRRITLAPIVVMIGFILGIYAIMKKPKSK